MYQMMIKRGGGLVPAFERDEKWFSAIGDGEYVLFDTKTTNSKTWEQLKCFFGIMSQAWHQSERIQESCKSFDGFKQFVLVELGHVEMVKTKSEIRLYPKSIQKCSVNELSDLIDRELDLFTQWGLDVSPVEEKWGAGS